MSGVRGFAASMIGFGREETRFWLFVFRFSSWNAAFYYNPCFVVLFVRVCVLIIRNGFLLLKNRSKMETLFGKSFLLNFCFHLF